MIEIKDSKGMTIAKVGDEKEAVWFRLAIQLKAEIQAFKDEIMIKEEILKMIKAKGKDGSSDS